MSSLDSTTMRPARRERGGRADAARLVLTIAHHADPDRVGDYAALAPSLAGQNSKPWKRKISRLEPEFTNGVRSLPLADRAISRRPFELSGVGADVKLRLIDADIKVEINGQIVRSDRTISSEDLDRGVTISIADRCLLLLRRTCGDRATPLPPKMIGVSDELRQVSAQIERAAMSDVNVLIRGATGTGKELCAEAIHRASSRADGPFIAVNMTTLLPSTASSQLFGHSQGAFTGASSAHAGFFATASGGTLFLDEIGETPSEIQPMLLRTLETGEVIPIGKSIADQVSVRLIAATDAPLEALVEGNTFRAPLFHRLAGFQIDLPSLCERREDIGPLLVHFLRDELAKVHSMSLRPRGPDEQLWLGVDQVRFLLDHSWPGNVRELRNLARHLALSCGGADEVSDGEFARALRLRPQEEAVQSEGGAQVGPDGGLSSPATATAKTTKPPEAISDDELVEALRANQWRTSATAIALGISRTSLYGLIERCAMVRKARDIGIDELTKALELANGSSAAAAARLEVSGRGLKLRMKELGIDGQ